MTLLDFTRYVLVLIGLVYLTSMAAIVAPVRAPLARLHPYLILLWYCPVCVAMWLGMALAALGISPFEHIRHWYEIIESGVIAMAITTVWYQALYQGASPTFHNEQPQYFTSGDDDAA